MRRCTRQIFSILLLCAGACVPVPAATWFVSPQGSDSAAGGIAAPFRTLQKGQDVAAAGDTVYIRGGTYLLSGAFKVGVDFSRSGDSGKPIRYWAYGTEKPVFDASGLDIQDRIKGFNVTASWIHLRGIELFGVPQRITTANESWGVWISGSHNIFERMRVHHIQGPGFFIAGAGGDNLYLNSDSYFNYDPLSKAGAGENADGFGIHSTGTGNVIRGCRAWWNSDDGYDFISNEGSVLVENSWSALNGYLPGTTANGKNGAGFKMGKSYTGVRHVIRNCVSFLNRSQGFYANHSNGGNDWFNNTAYNNRGAAFDLLSDTALAGARVHRLRNNIAFQSSRTANNGASEFQNNTWDLAITPAASDFLSVDTAGVFGPRTASGGVPQINFLRLKSGSRMIDKGIGVGLAHAGASPDLGAFEFGAVTALAGWERGAKSSSPSAGWIGVRDLAQYDVRGRVRPRVP